MPAARKPRGWPPFAVRPCKQSENCTCHSDLPLCLYLPFGSAVASLLFDDGPSATGGGCGRVGGCIGCFRGAERAAPARRRRGAHEAALHWRPPRRRRLRTRVGRAHRRGRPREHAMAVDRPRRRRCGRRGRGGGPRPPPDRAARGGARLPGRLRRQGRRRARDARVCARARGRIPRARAALRAGDAPRPPRRLHTRRGSLSTTTDPDAT